MALTQLNRASEQGAGDHAAHFHFTPNKGETRPALESAEMHQLNNTVSSETSAYVGLKRRATRQNVTYTTMAKTGGTEADCG